MTTPPLEPVSVYVHVPFCSSRCAYCNFYSGEPLEAMGEFPSLIGLEAGLKGPGLAKTLYIGGGTPSLLGNRGLAELIRIVEKSFKPLDGAEVTVEVNPGSPLDWQALRAAGVNRASIGVQALGEMELSLLGRRHTPSQALEAVRGASKAGLRVSADLIYGYKGCAAQNLASWARVLVDAGAGHLSAYSLEPKAGGPEPVGEELEERQGEAIAEELSLLDFTRYEVSNFCRHGEESRHNLAYWEGRGYLGLGPGAHSFDPDAAPFGRRFWNAAGLAAYREAVKSGAFPPGGEEFPTGEEALLERLFLILRRRATFSSSSLPRGDELLPFLDTLVAEGDLARVAGDYAPTSRGLLRADGLASWLHAKLYRSIIP